MNDQDVRDMLGRRAGDVTPAGDAWERIVERIAGDELVPVTELAPRRRRFSRPPIVLGAAAAAMLLVVAAGTLLQDGGDGETVRATDDPSATTTATTPLVAAPTFESAAEQAAQAWVEAIGAGDFDRAWDLLADQSRAASRGRDGFDASRTALAEGWGRGPAFPVCPTGWSPCPAWRAIGPPSCPAWPW